MAFKMNKVKVDLCSYPHYLLLAPRKFGKTTFWSELVKEAWGDESKGLLISFGDEEGYHAIDNIQVEVAREWSEDYDETVELRGFVEIVDDIVENNKTYGIKGVCFDTFDTMVDVAIAEVLRLHRKEKGTPCKSLNEAFSGYGRGKDRLIELIREQVSRLRDCGIAVFILCHTKLKEKTDLLSGEKYEQLTNNLQDNIYSSVADTAQMVMVGALDREINDGKIIDEKRVVYLRGNSLVDAGSRFDGIPEKIELSPKAFLEAFEVGVRNSIKKPLTDKEFQKAKKEEIKNREKTSEKLLNKIKEDTKKEEESEESEAVRNQYIEIITSKFGKAEDDIKKQAKKLLVDNGCKKFTDAELPIEVLGEIAGLF